ncbi:MAG TPA: hypothetical protein VK206_09925 [Anaerolineales bacterium]|nr:hypothetical protein [Anaerolineales bacterium]
MSGVGQPDTLPSHKLRVDGVVCIEAAGTYAATNIITAPNTFTLRTEFGFDGNLDSMLVGDKFDVVHHWQRVEDGATGRLSGSATDTNVAISNPISHIQVTSGPYTTTGSNVGADLTIPAGFDAGTYRIFTHIHFRAPNHGTVAGFNDGLVIVVVA